MSNHPNRNAFSIPVPQKLVRDLLSHFGPDPVTRGWCVGADTMEETRRMYVKEVLDESKEPEGDNVTTHWLTNKALRAGLVAMTKYPDALGQLLDETTHDAPTADLFVQCCIFGEEKYA